MIIKPEIFTPAVLAAMDTSLRIGRLCYDATSGVEEIRESGQLIHFPKMNRVAKAVDVQKNVTLIPDGIDMSDTTAIIKHVAVPLYVTDDELVQIKGPVKDNLVMDCAGAMSRRIEEDLIAAAEADAVYKTPLASATAVSADELLDGISNFKDQLDTDSFAGIAISDGLWRSFIGMDEFVSTNLTYQTAGNGKVVNGVIGYFLGIPVVTTNLLYDSVNNENRIMILKKNSLGYIFQRNINIEEQRDLLNLRTNIVASSFFTTKLLNIDGCVILKRTIA